jgi:hypothetical protein
MQSNAAKSLQHNLQTGTAQTGNLQLKESVDMQFKGTLGYKLNALINSLFSINTVQESQSKFYLFFILQALNLKSYRQRKYFEKAVKLCLVLFFCTVKKNVQDFVIKKFARFRYNSINVYAGC